MVSIWWEFLPQLFHDGGNYHIETCPTICAANQWTGFYMTETFHMKELNGLIMLILISTNSTGRHRVTILKMVIIQRCIQNR